MEKRTIDVIAVDGSSALIESKENPISTVRALPSPRSGRQGAGGPRSAHGKQISAQNSIRHGILSRAPIVGDETIEEWELHLAGVHQSLRPENHLEEVLVHQLAQNRWVRARLDRWSTEVTQHQFELATAWSPEERTAAHAILPQDEALWSDHDAQSILEGLEALGESDAANSIESGVARGIVFALEVSTSRHTRGDFRCGDLPGGDPGDGEVTVARMLQCVQEVADARKTTIDIVLRGARALKRMLRRCSRPSGATKSNDGRPYESRWPTCWMMPMRQRTCATQQSSNGSSTGPSSNSRRCNWQGGVRSHLPFDWRSTKSVDLRPSSSKYPKLRNELKGPSEARTPPTWALWRPPSLTCGDPRHGPPCPLARAFREHPKRACS